MDKKYFAIKCINNPKLYWSNEDGWVEKFFDMFTLQETKILNLPIEGKWVKFHNNI